MARPVAADAEATRARILHSALKLVADNGIEGTSIRDVAAGAKVSLATVLHYYGSKDGLYEACIAAMYAELDPLRAALFASFRPGVAMDVLLADAVRAAVKFVRQHRTAHRILMRMMIDEGGMRAERRDKWLKPFVEDTSAILAPLLGLPSARVRLTAQTIVHLAVRYSLHNAAELRIITGEDDDAAALAAVEQHIIDVTLAMLLPAKSNGRSA
jgi:AcrR family transcriptional regulator